MYFFLNTWLGCDIEGAKELRVIYFPTNWGAKEPQNLPNHRVDNYQYYHHFALINFWKMNRTSTDELHLKVNSYHPFTIILIHP